jgi:hypothetical protein
MDISSRIVPLPLVLTVKGYTVSFSHLKGGAPDG